MQFIPASEWSAEPDRYTRMAGEDVGTPEQWVAHWPGDAHQFAGELDESVERLRAYERYHVKTKGWRGIAYDYAIDLAGRTFELRGTGQSGATSGDYDEDGVPNNRETDAVLFLVGVGQDLSEKMVKAAAALHRWSPRPWLEHWAASGDRECPGAWVSARIVVAANHGEFDEPTDQPLMFDQAVVAAADPDVESGRVLANAYDAALLQVRDDGTMVVRTQGEAWGKEAGCRFAWLVGGGATRWPGRHRLEHGYVKVSGQNRDGTAEAVWQTLNAHPPSTISRRGKPW